MKHGHLTFISDATIFKSIDAKRGNLKNNVSKEPKLGSLPKTLDINLRR